MNTICVASEQIGFQVIVIKIAKRNRREESKTKIKMENIF